MFSKDQIESRIRMAQEKKLKPIVYNHLKTPHSFISNPYLNLLAMLGVAVTPAMSQRQEDYLKKTSASKRLIFNIKNSQKYRYELPRTDSLGKKISGKWLAVDKPSLDIRHSNFVIDPSKMPVSIKRILIGMILRSSPYIQDFLSKQGYDLLTIFEHSKQQSLSTKYSDNLIKETQICELFEKLLDKKFFYFENVKEVLKNFFESISKDQLPSSLPSYDLQELASFLKKYKSTSLEESALIPEFSYSQSSTVHNTSHSQSPTIYNATNQTYTESTAPFKITQQEVISQTPSPIYSDEEYVSFERQINEFNLFLINQRLLREINPTKYPKLISLKDTKFFGMRFLAPKISYEPDIKKSFLKDVSQKFLQTINFNLKTPAKITGILKDLNLKDVDLTGLNLDNLILENCNLQGAVIPSAINLQIIGGNLSETKWLGSQINLMIGHNRFTLNKQIIFVRNALSRLQYSSAFKGDEKAKILSDLTDLFIFEIYRSMAKSTITTNCFNADFSECQIVGFVALNTDFRGAKFPYLDSRILSDGKFYGYGAIFFSECQNLILPTLKSNGEESLISFDFIKIKEKYQRIYGKNIIDLILTSFSDFQHLPTKLIKKFASGEKITIAIEIENFASGKAVSDSLLSGNMRLGKKIAQYLNELFDQKNIEFIVKEQNTVSADFTINTANYSSGRTANDFEEYETLSMQDAMEESTIYIDDSNLHNNQQFNSQLVIQSILRDVLFDIADPNYFEKLNSIGEISAFNSGSASINFVSIIIDEKVENIIFDPFFEHWLKPADYLATRMYLEAIGRFSEEQQIRSDLLVNISSLDDVRSGMIFQKTAQSLNAFRVSERVVDHCKKISVHKAKDLIKYCYNFHQQDCRDNSFLGENDQAILFELKTGEKKLILLSGGYINITIGYKDQISDIKIEDQKNSEFDKSKLGYLALLAILTIPCLIIAVKDIFDKRKKLALKQAEEEKTIAEASFEFAKKLQQKHIIKFKDDGLQDLELEFKNAQDFNDFNISDFTELNNLYINTSKDNKGWPNFLTINGSIFRNKNLLIKVLDVNGTFFKKISEIIDPQEKIKLVTFEDRLTSEKKFVIASSYDEFHIKFYESGHSGIDDFDPSPKFIELKSGYSITNKAIKIPITKLTDLEIFEKIKITDPISESIVEFDLFFGRDNFKAKIDLKELSKAGIKVKKYNVENIGLDIPYLDHEGLKISQGYVFKFESENPKYTCFGFFGNYKILNPENLVLIEEKKSKADLKEVVISTRPTERIESAEGVRFGIDKLLEISTHSYR